VGLARLMLQNATIMEKFSTMFLQEHFAVIASERAQNVPAGTFLKSAKKQWIPLCFPCLP
jgi:hypothetical protein